MISTRSFLASALLPLAMQPAAHAWTRVSCDLAGTVLTAPIEMRLFRTDGTELPQALFRMKVRTAKVPPGAQADTDCREFIDREIDVALTAGNGNGADNNIGKGQTVQLRYRYDEERGPADATHFERVR